MSPQKATSSRTDRQGRETAGTLTAVRTQGNPRGDDGAYEVPIVHLRVPAGIVDAGFFGTLAASAILGALDPPLALLIGTAVLIARHGHKP